MDQREILCVPRRVCGECLRTETGFGDKAMRGHCSKFIDQHIVIDWKMATMDQ